MPRRTVTNNFEIMKLGVNQNVFDTAGGTPVVKLRRLTGDRRADVFLKLEHLNPTGSAKDRAAFRRLDRAEETGQLKPGQALVEASTGNAAVALALASKVRGHRCIIVLPETSPLEYRALLEALRAEVRLNPASEGLEGAAQRAQDLARSLGAWYSGQFDDPEAWRDFIELGDELVANIQAEGELPGAFVCSIGTGAIVVAAAQALRNAFPGIRIQGVYGEGPQDLRLPVICGLSDGRSIRNAASDWVDGTTTISYPEASRMRRELARSEGLLVGDSTGANVVAALKLARELGPGRGVYSLSVDSGERYFSTEVGIS